MLPFEKRATDPGSWAYEHRVGLMVTVIMYLILGIVFMTSKIIIGSSTAHSEIIIDMQETPPPPPPKPLTPEERKAMEQDLQSARNQVSNEDSKTEAKQQNARNTPIPKDMAAKAEAVSERMRASREAYEQGLREEQAMIDARNAQKNQKAEKKEDVKVTGNVIISFSLEGRSFVYMHRPTYQCLGGGQVVVGIVVNRNGKVIGADVQSATSQDDCLIDRALEAAKLSRFNVDSSAPDKQSGTITYLFVPQ